MRPITIALPTQQAITVAPCAGAAISVTPVQGAAIAIEGVPGIPGPPGPPGAPGSGAGGGDVSFTFDQITPSDLWIITHDLGFRPNIHVSDTAGSEVEGAVAHISMMTAVLTFSAPFSGQARCS